MRVHCPACEAPNEVDGLAVVPGGFGFVCASCGQTAVLAPLGAPVAPAPVERAPEEPAPVEPGRVEAGPTPATTPATPPPEDPRAAALGFECPKCGHRQAHRRACDRCGLDTRKLPPGRRGPAFDPLAGHPAAAGVRAAWAKVAADLDDTAGHYAFIQLCAEQNLLEFAGQCYRKAHDAGGDEDERVAEYRDRVIQAALARVGRLEARSTVVASARLRGLLVLMIAAFILTSFTFGYFLLTRAQSNVQHSF